MAVESGQTRRWLLNASGTAFLAGTIAPVAIAQTSSVSPPAEASSPAKPASPPVATGTRDAVSADAAKLADYIAGTLDRELPADVVARVKMHILDTFGAMISGSRLKPGQLAARYVESLGGKPEATVIGSRFRTCSVHAVLANAMMAQADETDDTNPVGPVHPGCMSVPAALAISEIAGRSGADFLRAVVLGYDVGARIVQALGANELSKRFDPSCVATSFVSAAVSAALLRFDQRKVRHTLSYAAQQASGMAIWRRDPDHIEKAFDFGGAGSRNGVMAATMVAFGFTGVEDPFSGDPSIFSALAERPAPEKLLADLGSKYSVFDTTIKKWSVGSPMQSVVNCMDELLKDPDVTAANVAHVTIDMPAYTLSIVDNATTPDLSAQHLVAMMLADHGLTFASIHDEKRMKDPKVLALRPLIELRGSDALNVAKPARQAIMTIDLKNGRSVNYHTVYVRGLSQNPMTQEEVEAKAVDLVSPVLGQRRTKSLITAINRLDSFGPISGLRPLLQA